MKKLVLVLLAVLSIVGIGTSGKKVEAHNEYYSVGYSVSSSCSNGTGRGIASSSQYIQAGYPKLVSKDYQKSALQEYVYTPHKLKWDLPDTFYMTSGDGGRDNDGWIWLEAGHILYDQYNVKKIIMTCAGTNNTISRYIYADMEDVMYSNSASYNPTYLPVEFEELHDVDIPLTDYEKAQALQFQLNYALVDYLLFNDGQSQNKWTAPSFVGSPDIGGIDEMLEAVMKAGSDKQWTLSALSKMNELQYGIIFVDETHYNDCIDYVNNY